MKMSSGYYKSGDTALATRDWVSMTFHPVRDRAMELLVKGAGFDFPEEFLPRVTLDEEENEDENPPEYFMSWFVWKIDGILELLIASGLHVFEVEEPLNELHPQANESYLCRTTLSSGHLEGIWIPLRTRFAQVVFRDEPAKYKKYFDWAIQEYAREGGSREYFTKCFAPKGDFNADSSHP